MSTKTGWIRQKNRQIYEIDKQIIYIKWINKDWLDR